MHQKSSTQYLICTNLEVPHLSVSMCRALFALVTISTAQVWERRTFRLVGRDWAHPKHVGITMGMLAVAVARTSAAKIAPCILLDRHATSGEDVVELMIEVLERHHVSGNDLVSAGIQNSPFLTWR